MNLHVAVLSLKFTPKLMNINAIINCNWPARTTHDTSRTDNNPRQCMLLMSEHLPSFFICALQIVYDDMTTWQRVFTARIFSRWYRAGLRNKLCTFIEFTIDLINFELLDSTTWWHDDERRDSQRTMRVSLHRFSVIVFNIEIPQLIFLNSSQLCLNIASPNFW